MPNSIESLPTDSNEGQPWGQGRVICSGRVKSIDEQAVLIGRLGRADVNSIALDTRKDAAVEILCSIAPGFEKGRGLSPLGLGLRDALIDQR